MNVTVEKLPECKASMRVEVPADVIAGERAKIVQTYAKQAKLPGFRPGKVPTAVIEKRFATQIASEVEGRVIDTAIKEGVKKEELKVLEVAAVEQKSHNPDGTFSFTAELVLSPEFELPEYKNIPVKVPPSEVTDAQLDVALTQLRERFADFADVEGRALGMGDFAVLDYKGAIGEQTVGEVAPDAPAHIAQNSGYWLRMDEGTFFPTFCTQLVGMNVGDERTVTITVPEDFRVEALRGREITYEVKLGEIKEQTLPELDDAFAARLDEGKTLEEVKVTLRENMEEDRNRRIDEFVTNQIVEFFNQNVDFELPRDAVMQEAQSRVNSIVEDNSKRGVNEEEIQTHREEIIQNATAQAKLTLKTTFILREIAKREKIEVTREQMLDRIAGIAHQQKTPVKKLIKELQKNDGISSIHSNLIAQNTIEFLKQHAAREDMPLEPEAEA
jgi:trigger factor